LQLFAITRKLKYLAPITHSDTHFRIFLDNKSPRLSGMLPYGKTADKVGIERGELEPIHDIDGGDCKPHVWALPLGRDSKALRARITYSNTLQLIREFPQHRGVAEFRDQKQEGISDSLVLFDKYTWPNKVSWPEPDPRYAGNQGDACLACQECNETLDKAKPKDSTPYQSCGCTLKTVPDYIGTPAVELFTAERTGVAVRALEHIAKGRLLDPYIGEIYPSHKSDDTSGSRKYGGTQGTSYVFEVPIQERHRVGSSSRMGKFAKNEWTHYVIDSAIKGNWTRYINRSCNPNTVFSKPQNIGGRNFILITAIRPIPFGEEITIDYGDEYFPPQGFGCRCGIRTCLAWNENELQFNDVMLEDAIRNGTAPGWAATKKGARRGIAVPIEDEVLYTTAKTKAEENRKKREERDSARAEQEAREATTDNLDQTNDTPASKKPPNARKPKPAHAKTKTTKASTQSTKSAAAPATAKGIMKMRAARTRPRQRNGQFAPKTTGIKRQGSDTVTSASTQPPVKRSRKK
jgi:SET domain